MDVAHLWLLRELADRGSVTEVAYATGKSPSAVSAVRQPGFLELGNVNLLDQGDEFDTERIRLQVSHPSKA